MEDKPATKKKKGMGLKLVIAGESHELPNQDPGV